MTQAYLSYPEDDPTNDPVVIVCQGAPYCKLSGLDAERAQRHGCTWCKRVTVHPRGEPTIAEPGHA